MSRISAMTIGMVLIFVGVQLFLVKSYLLTPTATRFLQEHFSASSGSRFSPPGSANNQSAADNNSLFGNSTPAPGQSWPYYRTNQSGNSGIFQNSSWNADSSFQPVNHLTGRHRFVPPSWIKWPALFLGAVFFLHGAALRT